MSLAAPDFLPELQSLAQAIVTRHAPVAAEKIDSLGGLATAVHYAVSGGGKYIRPVLALCAFRACDPAALDSAVEPAMAAIELMHIYSLIHDDLPAMDDDDLRRGRPSLHKAYDEATAILVGDGLQTAAFELLADSKALSPAQQVHMVKVLATAAGVTGMVGGQYIDIQATDSDMSLAGLQQMHALKTGALIGASLALGGIAAGASEEELAALDQYGGHIGLAFQVVDDVLDVDGDPETLGKTQGKDEQSNKPTYVKLLGLEGAREEARRLLASALDALAPFDESADQLRELAQYIVARDH